MRPSMIAVAVACLFASSARAQTPSAAEGQTNPGPAPEGQAPARLVLTLPWTDPSGEGASLAYENGAFGQTFEQAIRFELPLLEHFAVTVRAMALYAGPQDSGVAFGGRLDLIGRTSVLLNLVRIYGGGGGGVFTNVSGSNKGATGVEGGGQFGVEFFLQPHASFYLEIGGNGCSALSGSCSGATAIAGVNLYPF